MLTVTVIDNELIRITIRIPGSQFRLLMGAILSFFAQTGDSFYRWGEIWHGEVDVHAKFQPDRCWRLEYAPIYKISPYSIFDKFSEFEGSFSIG